tara:strand:- start:563 stop:721 length:159 start_codon:yes stop_codon:yes gene_type:complete
MSSSVVVALVQVQMDIVGVVVLVLMLQETPQDLLVHHQSLLVEVDHHHQIIT